MWTRAALYNAAAAALRPVRAGCDAAALRRAHAEHCWRARHGLAAHHLAIAAAIRRRLAVLATRG